MKCNTDVAKSQSDVWEEKRYRRTDGIKMEDRLFTFLPTCHHPLKKVACSLRFGVVSSKQPCG